MGVSVDKDEQELLEDFRGLSSVNKSHLLSLAHATKVSQENTISAMESARRAAGEEKDRGKPAA